MISAQRSRELDYYFNKDHLARRKALFRGVSLGSVSFFLFHVIWSIGVHLSLVAASAVMCIFFVVWVLVFYKPVARNVDSRPGRPLVATNLHERRQLLWGIAVCAGAVVLSFLSSDSTEAEIVDSKIRKLISAGRASEATTEVESAISSNISLKPDALFATANSISVASLIAGTAAPPSSESGRASVVLDGTETISISLPVLLVNKGRWPVASLVEAAISFIGEGPGRSVMVPYGDTQKQDQAFFVPFYKGTGGSPSLDASQPADMLIYGIAFAPQLTSVEKRLFLEIGPRPTKIAIYSVVIESMSVILDRIIWGQTEFRDCDIRCDGEWFELRAVSFVNCVFSFTRELPEDVKVRLETNQGRKISYRFRRGLSLMNNFF